MKCDQKTIDLLFDSYLDILGWGAHHFPDGCIIEDNTIVDCFQKCEDILKEKTVSERLINQLNYYRILYECYNRYVDDGRKRKYEDYLIYIFCIAEHFTMRNKLSHRGETFSKLVRLSERRI